MFLETSSSQIEIIFSEYRRLVKIKKNSLYDIRQYTVLVTLQTHSMIKIFDLWIMKKESSQFFSGVIYKYMAGFLCILRGCWQITDRPKRYDCQN